MIVNPAVMVAQDLAVDLDSPAELAELSLEQLANIEITSVAKYAQTLLEAAASIYVITRQDIARSGATSIPEALRLAPNLQVARSASNEYAITARGFNAQAARLRGVVQQPEEFANTARGFDSPTANKLLVLIDGRSIYTPLFSGVFWDVQDTLIEDIERIEVISGPGATLWGANAVNGVINIITRNATETVGKLASAVVGNEQQAASFRYGAHWSDTTSYRVYGKTTDYDASVNAQSVPQPDAWQLAQTGFRIDQTTTGQTLTVQGDLYRGSSEQPSFDERTLEGGNLLGRWRRPLPDDGHLQLQAYYDHTKRVYPGVFSESLDVFDLQIQHRVQLVTRHDILWGGGYRYAEDQVQNNRFLAFLPANRALHQGNVFVQDEIALLPERLNLTLGTKFEHNNYSGLDILPSARLSWTVSAADQFWAAVSRAARAPSRIDRDFTFTSPEPPFVFVGGPDFQSEKVTAFELGYRTQLSSRASLSATVFHQVYRDLKSLEVRSPGEIVLGNRMQGESSGLELWGEFWPHEHWRLQASYQFLDLDLRLPADSIDQFGIAAAGNDPEHQFKLRSSLDLPNNWSWDLALRHVSRLPNPRIAAYTAVDVSLRWTPDRPWELTLIAQNLLDPSHPEFSIGSEPREIERSIAIRATWRY